MTELNEFELEEINGGASARAPYKTHVVKSGECLSGIALKYKTTVEFLAKLNNIPNPDRLSAGRKLLVPNPNYGN